MFILCCYAIGSHAGEEHIRLHRQLKRAIKWGQSTYLEVAVEEFQNAKVNDNDGDVVKARQLLLLNAGTKYIYLYSINVFSLFIFHVFKDKL